MSDAEVLRSDVLGWMRTSRERRNALLGEFEKSGISAAKLAALAGVNYQTFADDDFCAESPL